LAKKEAAGDFSHLNGNALPQPTLPTIALDDDEETSSIGKSRYAASVRTGKESYWSDRKESDYTGGAYAPDYPPMPAYDPTAYPPMPGYVAYPASIHDDNSTIYGEHDDYNSKAAINRGGTPASGYREVRIFIIIYPQDLITGFRRRMDMKTSTRDIHQIPMDAMALTLSKVDMMQMGTGSIRNKTMMHMEEHIIPSKQLNMINSTLSSSSSNNNNNNNRLVKCHRGTDHGGTADKRIELVIMKHRHHLLRIMSSALLPTLYNWQSTLCSHQSPLSISYNLHRFPPNTISLRPQPTRIALKKNKEQSSLLSLRFSLKDFSLYCFNGLSGCSPADPIMTFSRRILSV
jgi:hypothetical protein